MEKDSLGRTSMMNKGLNYVFKLRDLTKYSQRLKPNDLQWKMYSSALGTSIKSPD